MIATSQAAALRAVASRALEHFGLHVRTLKLLEEMGELQSELVKTLLAHKRTDTARVIDEIADVYITLESITLAYGDLAVADAIASKLQRLERAISDEPATADAQSDRRWLKRIAVLESRLRAARDAAEGVAR